MRLLKMGALTLVIALIGAHVAWGLAWGQGRPEILLASYTHHTGGARPGGGEKAHVVMVRVAGEFTAKEQADIASAIVEWNHTLNGYVRFEVHDSGDRTDLTVLRIPDKGLPLNGPSAQRLALTLRTPADGGVIMVFGDRIGVYDLRRIMLHEFGHLLGLGHDDNSDLMFPRYFHSRQACIDRATVQMLASQRSWQIDRMNWCGPLMAASPPKADGSGPEQGREPKPRTTGQERRMTRGAPWLHEEPVPPAAESANELPEFACPQGLDWHDDNRIWWERVLADAHQREGLGLSR
jgi:hypothetical protein